MIVFEPMILNEPVSTGTVVVAVTVAVEVVVAVVVAVVVVVAVLQPARVKAATSTSARGKNHFFTDLNNLFSFYYLFSVMY